MYLSKVQHGPPRGICCGRWARVARRGTTISFTCCSQRAAAQVCLLCLKFVTICNTLLICRLNAHLSSIASSKPFQMPVDVVPRTTAFSGSRLSSFGVSGTIAHGAFGAPRPPTSDIYFSPACASLYRTRHHLSQNKHMGRLFIARHSSSNPLSTLAGRSAVYCKVQTISRPFKCVTQKTVQATDVDQDHKENSLPPLNTNNFTMGSWKRLLGTALNAPGDFSSQSSPNTSFAYAGDNVGIDAEVLRIVLAKAHYPLLRNIVYPEVQTQDLMNSSIRRQSTLVLMEGAVNSMSEA